MVRSARVLTRKSMALLTSLLLVLFWVPGLIAASPAYAAGSTPGGFEIEGNLLLDDTTTPLTDWETALSASDPANDNVAGDQTVFTEADKEDQSVAGWYLGTPPATPAKTDIGNVYSYVHFDPVTHHEFYNFAWDRGASTGTDYYYLELDKRNNTVSTPGAGKPPMSVPDRSDGAVRFKLHDQGSGVITLDTVAVWNTGTSTWTESAPSSSTAFKYGVSGVTTAGRAALPTGWTSPNATTVGGVLGFDSERFIETSFDLSALNILPSCPAAGFAKVNFRSTTGNSDTNLSDFIAPLDANIPSTCAQLHIRKYAGTTAADETDANLLAGATFSISPNPLTGSLPAVSVKDGLFASLPAGYIADPDHTADGKIDINTAQPGHDYTITETAPPPGYLISGTDHYSTGTLVESQSADPVKFLDTLGSLTFFKVDAQSTTTPVGGASFLVHRVSGNGTQADVSVTDKTPTSTGSNDDSSVAGTMTVSSLKTGTYAITETTPLPAGYDKDNSTIYITIDQTHPTGFLSDNSGNPISGTATFHDPRLPVTLRVIKTDGGACDPDATTPSVHCLAGAVFGLYQLRSGTGVTPNISLDTLVSSVDPNPCTTNSHGACTVTVPHWGGTYYWYEVSAPTGYNLPSNRYSSTISLSSYPTNGVGPDRAFADNRPSISTTATDAVIGHAISDSATLTNVPTGAHGTVTFTVYGPFASASDAVAANCTPAHLATGATNPIVVNVTNAAAAISSGDFPTSALGYYAWKAVYSGDATVGAAGVAGVCGDVSGSNDEVSQVTPEQPQIATTAGDTNTVTGTMSDSATLTHFFGTPTGNVTFTLYKVCGGPVYGSVTVPISANGTASTVGHAATTGTFNADNTTASYHWAASYSNDVNNSDVSELCADGGASETSHAPVLDAPHKYNDPGVLQPPASPTDPTVSIYANNNQIHYTITVHNSGLAQMNGVTVTDTVSSLATYDSGSIGCAGDAASCVKDASAAPALSWTFNLPVDGTAILTFSVTVKTSDLRTDVIQNQAHVSNGTVTRDTEIRSNPLAYPNLSINKCSSPAPQSMPVGTNADCTVNASGLVAPNSSITYALTVTNTGNADATGVKVTDAVPTHTSFVSATCDSPCSAAQASGTVTWSNVTVLAGHSTVVHFTVNVDSNVTNGTNIDNVGSFTWSNSGSTTTSDESGTSATVRHVVGFPVIGENKFADPLPIGDPIPGTEKTADGIVHLGDTITYTVQATNSGLASSPVTITDAIPDGTTYVAVSAKCDAGAPQDCSAPASPSGGVLTWTMTLPGNSSATVSFQVTVDSGDTNGQILSNHAVVNNHNTRTVTHEVTFPIVTAVKSSDPATGTSEQPTLVGPNTVIHYTVAVTNSGLQDAAGVTVTDQVPTGTTYDDDASCGSAPNCSVQENAGLITWTLDVPAGTTQSVTFSVTTPTVQSALIDNTASFTNLHGCTVTEANTCDTNTTHHEVVFPVINAHKTSDPATGTQANPATVTPNQVITYTIAVTNSGEANANGVVVHDSVPTNTTYVAGSATATGGTESGGVITWTINVAKHTTVNLTFQAQVPAGATNGTLIDNTATFTNVHTPDCVAAGETACSTETTHHEVRFPIVSASKSSDPVSGTVEAPTPVTRGQTIHYTITVQNTGLVTATGVAVSDAIPSGTTYTPLTVDNGGSYDAGSNTVNWTINVPPGGLATAVALHFDVTVNGDALNGKLIDNTATVNDVPTNTTHHEVEFPIIASLKSSDPASGTVEAPTPVKPGQTISYTVAVTNSGLAAANGVVVTDAIPTGTTYTPTTADHGGVLSNSSLTWTIDVPAQSTVNLHFQVTVNGNDANGTLIDNTAVVNEVPTNTTHHEVEFPIVGSVKSSDPTSGTKDAPTPVSPGQTISYTVAVSNTGLALAPGVVITDAIPTGTTYVAGSADHSGVFSGNSLSWTIDVAAGATVNLHFQVTVNGTDGNGTLIDNTAVVNDTPTNTTHHEVEFPVLTLAKSSNPVSGSIVQRGDRIDYTITLANTGLAASAPTTITDTLPTNVTIVGGSASPAFTTVNGNVVTWTVTVPAGQTKTLTYGVTVNSDAPQGATLTNVALVNGQCVGNADESACTTDHHVPTGALTLVKHVDKATAAYGDTLTYTFDASTTGALDQTGVVVTDVLPKGTAYVNGSAACTDGGTCTASFNATSKTVTWQLGDMAAGTTRHLVFKVTIVKPSFNSTTGLPATTIVNSGAIQSNETPNTPSNQVVTKVVAVLGVKVVRPPVLAFTGLPAQVLLTMGLLMLGAGIILTSVRRKEQ